MFVVRLLFQQFRYRPLCQYRSKLNRFCTLLHGVHLGLHTGRALYTIKLTLKFVLNQNVGQIQLETKHDMATAKNKLTPFNHLINQSLIITIFTSESCSGVQSKVTEQ